MTWRSILYVSTHQYAVSRTLVTPNRTSLATHQSRTSHGSWQILRKEQDLPISTRNCSDHKDALDTLWWRLLKYAMLKGSTVFWVVLYPSCFFVISNASVSTNFKIYILKIWLLCCRYLIVYKRVNITSKTDEEGPQHFSNYGSLKCMASMKV